MRTTAAIACTAVLLTAASAAAQVTEDRTTFVTFSGPVSLPGKTLPAGTYTFKLADNQANRHIVQIFDRDQSKLFATLLAVPAERAEAEGDPVVTFKETPADRPPAVRYWYYAGEKSGNEFVYPKTQAVMIARASGEPVMAVETESTSIEDWKKGTPERVTADAAPQTSSAASSTTAQAPPASAAGQPSASASASTTTSPSQPNAAATSAERERTTGTSGRTTPRELPRTASEVPAAGLIGILSLAAALMVRFARRAVA